VAGFVILAVGLATLTVNRRHGRLDSPQGTWRSVLYIVIYGLCAGCFARVLSGALLGSVRSPWLLALGDVISVTLALFVWVMVLAENRGLGTIGFRGVAAGRLLLTLLMGVGATFFYAGGPWKTLLEGRAQLGPDTMVFALLWAALGSALPEEILFRGYLAGSLDGRLDRWSRVILPAVAFTLVRGVRYLPGSELALSDWLYYVAGVVFPLGLWWGLMRDLARGSLWPSLVSHFLLEFVTVLAGTSPAVGSPAP
jgi:membrane protease YdiL (CAAX protease family)